MEFIVLLGNFLASLLNNWLYYLGGLLAVFLIYKTIIIILKGLWENYFKTRFNISEEKRKKKIENKKEIVKGYDAFFKLVCGSDDFEIVAGKRKGKTTLNNAITWFRNDNKIRYIKSHMPYYEIMEPSLLAYMKECESNGKLPFVATNFYLRDKISGLENQDPMPFLTQEKPAFYGMFFGLTEMRSYLAKSLYNKKNTKKLDAVSETFEKSGHLKFYITIDSLKEKDYYIGVRIGEPLLMYPQKTKYFFKLGVNVKRIWKICFNFLWRGLVGKIAYKINKKNYKLLKAYFVTAERNYIFFEKYKSIKVRCIVWNKLHKFIIPWNKYFAFASEHFKKEYAKKFENKIVTETKKDA